MPVGSFRKWSKMRGFNLPSNAFETLDVGTFTAMTDLDYIDLTGTFSASARVVMTGELFRTLTKVRTIQLDTSQVVEIEPDAFSTTRELRILVLQNNDLTAVPVDAFRHLSKLTTLNLQRNFVTQLAVETFGALTAVEYLWLNNNRLAEIPSGLFDGLASVESLDIFSNRITSVAPGLFNNCSSVETLRMHDNPIAVLPERTFAPLEMLQRSTFAMSMPDVVTVDATRHPRLTSFAIAPAGWLEQPCRITDGGRCITDGSLDGPSTPVIRCCPPPPPR